MWPTKARRERALQGYRALGMQHRETLADIAYRNNVFNELPLGMRRDDVLIAEGRRRCAIEICKLANMDVDLLWEQIEKREQPREGQAR